MNLQGQKVLITGGGSGIGLALATRLAASNQVVVVGRDQAKLTQARGVEPSLQTLAVNIGTVQGAEEAVSWAAEVMGGVSLLVNSAGIMRPYSLDQPDAVSWLEEDIRSNLLGTALVTGLALPHLRAAPEAAVVFMSSAVAYAAAPGWSVYAATKTGVRSLARSLRTELEPSGIRVVEVAPTVVDTPPAAGLDVPKLSVERVVDEMITGLGDNRTEIRIGRTRALAALARLAPGRADAALSRALGDPSSEWSQPGDGPPGQGPTPPAAERKSP